MMQHDGTPFRDYHHGREPQSHQKRDVHGIVHKCERRYKQTSIAASPHRNLRNLPPPGASTASSKYVKHPATNMPQRYCDQWLHIHCLTETHGRVGGKIDMYVLHLAPASLILLHRVLCSRVNDCRTSPRRYRLYGYN